VSHCVGFWHTRPVQVESPPPSAGPGVQFSPDRLAKNGRRRLWRGLAAAVLVVGNLFLHKPISDVCDALYARVGRTTYEWVTLIGISALSVTGAFWLLRGGAPVLRRPRWWLAVAVLAAMTVATQHLLLVTNVELIHLPQFALLAALLSATGLPGEVAWFAASLGGALDEAYQWRVIYAGVPNTYFDWNDIVLNALGAAWAVLLIDAGRRAVDPLTPRQRRVAGVIALLGLLGLVAAFALAPPRLIAAEQFPFVAPQLGRAMTGRMYHVMPASEGLVALLVIWAAVTTGLSRRTPPLQAGAALLALLLFGGCAPQPAPRPPAPARAAGPAHPFFITFWCGPPLGQLTDARAAEIAAAGFDVIGAPCEGMRSPALIRQALDVAARHDLTLMVSDPRVDLYDPLPADWPAQVSQAVADYAAHPGFAGYFLVDEPGADRFPDIAPVVAYLRLVDPAHLAYVNLLPDYVSPLAYGAGSYRDYVERYMEEVRPALLSVDYYPFRATADRDSFFSTLALMREQALAAGVPWMLIIQAMPHGPYRDPSEAEMAWQIFHAMAFGARGLSYFTYWTPVHVEGAADWQFRRGLVEHGTATDKLPAAARLNAAARAIADQLDDFTSLGVLDSAGAWPRPSTVSDADLPPLQILAGGPVTVGLFGAADGRRATLLVNQDYRSETRLLVGSPAEHVVLPPGEAVLVR
jgi:hypothetical protein